MLQRKWTADRKSPILTININTSEDLIAVAFKSNNIATFEMSQVLPSTAETIEIGKNFKYKKEVKFDYVYNGFHNGGISSLDVCVQRPLIATSCKQDSTIRIWNYINFKCEVARYFYVGDETKGDLSTLLCLAFHPTGYYLAVGFIDKLRFFHILHSSLREYKEIGIKGCTQVRFSRGGQYLAAAYPRNKQGSYNIAIYNSFSIQQLAICRGCEGIVEDLFWSKNDKSLLACGDFDGIMEWDALNWNKKEYIGGKYNSLVMTEDKIYGSCQENNKNLIVEMAGIKGEEKERIEKGRSYIIQGQLKQMAYLESIFKANCIIGGNSEGYLQLLNSGFGASERIPAHYGSVTKIRISPDRRFVFSGGEDGSVFIFQVGQIKDTKEGQLMLQQQLEGQDEGREINANIQVADEQLADVVLVPRIEIDNYLNDLKNLSWELEELNNKIEFSKQEEKQLLEKKKQEAEVKMNMEINGWTKRYEELKVQKGLMEGEANSLRKAMEINHEKAVEELETLYEKKLAFENEKYLQLVQELKEVELRHEKQVRELRRKHEQTVKSLENEFVDKFDAAENVYDSTRKTADQLTKIYDERLQQQEDEHETEVEDLKTKQKKEIDSLKEQISQLQRQNETFVQQNRLYEEQKDRLEKNDKERQNKIEGIQLELMQEYNTIRQKEEQIKEMDESLKKKEKKIYEYKYKISDLQKSKHVLSFRTTEMRKSLEPKEAQIEKLKEELFKLEGEFEQMLKTSAIQNDNMKKMKNQIDSLQKQVSQQVDTTKKKEYQINKMLVDINSLTHNVDRCHSNQQIKEKIRDLENIYKNYVLNEDTSIKKQDPKAVDEMVRKISHLENNINQMHTSSVKILERREIDIRKKTSENAGLIFDLNEIKKSYKQLEQEKKKIQIINSELSIEKARWHDQVEKLKKQVEGKIGGLKPIQKNENSEQNMKPVQQPQEKKEQSQLQKGGNVDSRTLNTFDKAKMMDLMIELESSTQKLMMQDNEIMILKNKIRRHIEEKGCKDLSFDDEESQIIQAISGSQQKLLQYHQQK